MNEFAVQIKWNKKETLAHMSWIERDQYPFAHAKALTRVAQESAEMVRKKSRETFELKTDFIPKGVAVTSAKKADIVSGGRATSSVFTKERIGSFMVKQEIGGERKATGASIGGGGDSGKSLAIPGKGVAGSQFSTSKLARARFMSSSGKILKRFTPTELLKGTVQSTPKKTQRGGHKKAPFIIKGRQSGVPMIVRRIGKKKYPLEILYIFRSSASYKARWGMIDTVVEYVNANYERIFKEELKRAVEES
jgi:hypothetical protein